MPSVAANSPRRLDTAAALALSPDGSTLYALRQSGRISDAFAIIDTAGRTTTATLPEQSLDRDFRGSRSPIVAAGHSR